MSEFTQSERAANAAEVRRLSRRRTGTIVLSLGVGLLVVAICAITAGSILGSNILGTSLVAAGVATVIVGGILMWRGWNIRRSTARAEASYRGTTGPDSVVHRPAQEVSGAPVTPVSLVAGSP